MKKVILLLILFFFQQAFAGEPLVFDKALQDYYAQNYSGAKNKFKLCLNDPEYKAVEQNIKDWIALCDSLIEEEQKKNLEEIEKKRKQINEERKKRKDIFISVNAATSDEFWPRSTQSSLFEVLRNHNRSFNSKLDEAYSYITVDITSKEYKQENRFIVDTYGFMRFDNAFNLNDIDIEWSTGQCRKVSYESFDDAKNRSYEELNSRLAEALDCYLSNKPLPQKESIKNNNIVVSLVTGNGINEEELTEFTNAISYYIDTDETYTSNNIMNQSLQKIFQDLYLKQLESTKVDKRIDISELDGISYVLFIEVKFGNEGNYTFKGTIIDCASWNTTLSSKPLSIKANKLTKKNQELAAAMMCESLGLKKWVIGEELCGGKLLRAPIESDVRLSGLICYILEPTQTKKYPLQRSASITNSNMSYHSKIENFDPGNSEYWRYPRINEMNIMAKYMDVLGLYGLYWTDYEIKGKPVACEISNYESKEKPKSSKASTVIVREF